MAHIQGEYRLIIEGENKNLPKNEQELNKELTYDLPNKISELLNNNLEGDVKAIVRPVNIEAN